jgi:16S rRNA (cytosine967-C5)-methyltransferase
VLRRVATRDLPAWLDIVAPGRDQDPAGHLAVRHSHPRWIVEAMAAALGEDPAGGLTETEAMLVADNEPPAVHLCIAPGHEAARHEVLAADCVPARWSPAGAYLAGGDPAGLPAVAAGQAWVQDEASQLAAIAVTRAAASAREQVSVARAAARVAGSQDRWLDLCAGPGGKARLLAKLAAAAGARLLAADLREHRARLVQDGVTGGVIVADGRVPAWRHGRFCAVLADVPCSGLGALRRRPEARWRRAGIAPDLAALQRELLGTALNSAEPGGVVGYVTCSPHIAETREVVAAALAHHPGTEVLDAPAVLAEVPSLRCPEPYSRYAQFWPHRHGTDAIFVALLRRSA